MSYDEHHLLRSQQPSNADLSTLSRSTSPSPIPRRLHTYPPTRMASSSLALGFTSGTSTALGLRPHFDDSALSNLQLTGQSGETTNPDITPKQRFHRAAKKVILLNRATTHIHQYSRLEGPAAGAEPGIDPRQPLADLEYGHIKQDCVIEIMDYSAVRSSFGKMTNREFINLLEDEEASKPEPWVKVRWINVGGVSWDVIKALALRYDLHPLTIEDIFYANRRNASKVDYHANHLFISVLCHELGERPEVPRHQTAAFGSTLMDDSRSESPDPIDDSGGEIPLPYDEGFLTSPKQPQRVRKPIIGTLMSASNRLAALRKRREQEVKINTLKGSERIFVNISPMFIFLLRDGTVISIHSTPNLELTAPISQRIGQQYSILRQYTDASLMVHALLDLVVDKALDVISAYQTHIAKFEKSILLQPKVKTVRNLHILSEDLLLHKRTMGPIKTLINGLRRYDFERSAAQFDLDDHDHVDSMGRREGSENHPHYDEDDDHRPIVIPHVAGFMSHRSQTYLADVCDHMEYILSSLNTFTHTAEGLIDYTFNAISYQMTEVMRRLTIINVIFLPLTLLTYYFGMNFESFWLAKDGHSDAIYWYFATPIMIIILPIFIYPDLRRLLHHFEKRKEAKQAVLTSRRRQSTMSR
ncbi:hypothetical protein BDN72DRAFT_842745 [Pluteus cervinus]|uniref:Uncharacterized protein n=1 Tax=Pluteus cervinus TaxID=181527 RepID=A0ACD3APD7_9AGAR|nr:hypothetical protein BDN72DRAFT_842745 [Pluteus cervinus]